MLLSDTYKHQLLDHQETYVGKFYAYPTNQNFSPSEIWKNIFQPKYQAS